MLSQAVLYASMYFGLFTSVVGLLVFFSNRESFDDYPEPDSFPTVSIIVPAWNEEEYIGETIESLQRLEYPEDRKEIIVVDDGSTDNTSEVARGYDVRVIEKENGGKATALNRGSEEADGDIVACMDADSMVEPSALKKMVGHFEDPDVGAVTSSMKVQNKGDSLLARMQYVEYLFFIFMRKVLCLLDCVVVTPGPFSLYRKSLIKETGGFDNCNHVEDMDMTFKIHREGYRIPNVVDAEVRTYCPTSLRGLYNQRMRWFRGLIGTVLKYRDMVLNHDFGNFGLFILPVSAVSMVLTFFFALVVGWRMFISLWGSLVDAYLVGFDWGYLVSTMSSVFELSILSVNLDMIALVVAIALSSVILYISHRYSSERVRDSPVGTLGFLFFYPLLLAAFWSVAFVHEVRGTKKKWLHKSVG